MWKLILSHQVFEGCLLLSECVSVEHNHMTCVTFCLKDCWKIFVKLSDRAIFSQKNLALNLLAIFPTELFQTDLRIDFNHWQLFSKWYFRQSYTTWWHCKNYKYQFIAFWLFRSICSKNYGFCLVTYVLFSTPFHFYKKHWNCSSKLAVLQKNEKQISSKPPIYYRTDAKCLVWFKYHPLDLSAIIWMNFS